MLELGAGGGLPGLVTAKCGARKVRFFFYTFVLRTFRVFRVLATLTLEKKNCICSVIGGPHGLSGQGAPRQFNL